LSDFTKEAVDIVVDHGISGHYFTRVLDQAARFRALPKVIRTDQGPEFTGKALDQWAYERKIELRLIQAGKPTQNAYVECFNGIPRRMPERALVQIAARSSRYRCPLENRLQPTPAAQRFGISNPSRIWF
jgi:transposase InsO family protein